MSFLLLKHKYIFTCTSLAALKVKAVSFFSLALRKLLCVTVRNLANQASASKCSQRCFQCWYQATVEASLTSVSGTSGLRSFTTADTYFSWKGRMETAFYSIRISPFFHSSFLIAPDSICQRAGDTPTHTACNTVASQQNCKCTGGQHVAAGGKSHLTRRERRRIERETQRERRHSAICSLSTVSQMWFGT